MSNQHDGALTAAVLEAVKKPEGMRTSEIAGYTVQQVGRLVQKLQSAGHVHRAPIEGKFGRYFDSMKRAEEWAEAQKGCTPVVTIKPQKRWADDEPAKKHANFKHTIESAPPPRYAPDMQDTSWRLFSALKPGQYLEAA